MGKNGIARLDLVKGHAYHYNIEEELENGLMVEIDYGNGTVKPTTDATKQQHFLASVANQYDSADESDFINKPDGMKVRVFTFEVGDIVTTTQFTGDAVKGKYAVATEGGKLEIVDSEPDVEEGESQGQAFRVVEGTSLNGKEAVAIQVERV